MQRKIAANKFERQQGPSRVLSLPQAQNRAGLHRGSAIASGCAPSLSSQKRSNLFSSLVVLSAVSCLTSAATKSLCTLSARLSANTLSGERRRVQIRLRVILKISWDAVLLVLAGLLAGMRVQEGVANFRS